MNEATIVRLTYEDDASTRVRPRDLEQLIAGLEKVFLSAATSFGEASIDTFLVAPPRRGSIEFLIYPVIHVSVQVDTLVTYATAQGIRPGHLTRYAELAAIGSLLWMACFGGRGILDLFNGAKPLETTLDEPAVQYRIAPAELLRPEVRDALVDLAMKSLRTGALLVEIEVPDSGPVVVSDRRDRTKPGLIGRLSKLSLGVVPSAITRASDEQIRVRFREKEYVAFLSIGPEQGEVQLVLWGSAEPVPNEGQVVQIEAEGVGDLDEVDPLEPVPPSFDRVVAAIVVRRAAGWR